jgi:hypothetical protein
MAFNVSSAYLTTQIRASGFVSAAGSGAAQGLRLRPAKDEFAAAQAEPDAGPA